MYISHIIHDFVSIGKYIEPIRIQTKPFILTQRPQPYTVGLAIPRLTFSSARNRYYSKQVCDEECS